MSLGGSDPALTAPVPVQTRRTSGRDILAILRVRNFRLLISSMFFTSIAMWMTRIAVDWLMLELTGNLALANTNSQVGFWSYTVVEELPNVPEPSTLGLSAVATVVGLSVAVLRRKQQRE